MSYNKLGFTSGQTLKAEHLNHMEDGIANAGGVTSWNDLEDKPFYSEMVEGDSTFDGDLTGKEVFDMGDGMFLVKMSDTPIAMEELIDSTLLAKEIGGSHEEEVLVTADIIMHESIDESNYILGVMIGEVPGLLITHGDCSAAGMPPEGVYFVYVEAMGMYVASISCLNGMQEVVHKIDKKYLPEVGLKANEVQQMIDEAITNAIGKAIGGSY